MKHTCNDVNATSLILLLKKKHACGHVLLYHLLSSMQQFVKLLSSTSDNLH
jgi:hypothetical protein